jgi:hypothetical protein
MIKKSQLKAFFDFCLDVALVYAIIIVFMLLGRCTMNTIKDAYAPCECIKERA